jgi:hypothetical protein
MDDTLLVDVKGGKVAGALQRIPDRKSGVDNGECIFGIVAGTINAGEVFEVLTASKEKGHGKQGEKG